jgi:RimJ/RimL family protein N-acetyltransferase
MAALGGRLRAVQLPIQTERLSLRLDRVGDVPLLARHVNDPRVLRGILYEPRRFSRAEELQFLRANLRAARKGENLPLAITLRPTGELIGGVRLILSDMNRSTAALGYWVRPQHWHRGFGMEAVAAVCDLGFSVLKLHRIEANVFDSNARSMRLLRRLGFKKEGQREEVRLLDGRWEGGVMFGLLAGGLRRYARSRPERAR